MRILVCLDGSPTSEQAARFAGPLLRAPGQRVTLFGVVDRGRDGAAIQRALVGAAGWLASGSAETMVKTVHHRAADAILVEAEAGAYDLIVLGDPGRSGLARFLGGSLTERVVRQAPCAVLVARAGSRELRRILVCTAGGAPGLRDVHFTAPVAAASGAAVTVLHVMSQVALRDDVDTADLGASAADLIARGTPEGLHLDEARAILDAAGVQSTLSVRHGLVLDEIDAEVREGDYDLVVLGATLARGLSRLVLDNITRSVMHALDTAVLVVAGHEADVQRSGAT
jgi:nucleotide-binding universal stress UspA family protein